MRSESATGPSQLHSTFRLKALPGTEDPLSNGVLEPDLTKSSSTAVSICNLLSSTSWDLKILSSLSGLGPRYAGWFQSYIDDIAKLVGERRTNNIKDYVLKGGIKGRVRDFDSAKMNGFEDKYWEQFNNDTFFTQSPQLSSLFLVWYRTDVS